MTCCGNDDETRARYGVVDVASHRHQRPDILLADDDDGRALMSFNRSVTSIFGNLYAPALAHLQRPGLGLHSSIGRI
jgi:hypothetical protein